MSRVRRRRSSFQIAALLVLLAGAARARVVAPDLGARRGAHGLALEGRGGASGLSRQLTAGLARVGPGRDRGQLHRRVPHDLHLEQPLDDRRLHALDHVLEEVERLLLVLGERVPLAVAPEADPLLKWSMERRWSFHCASMTTSISWRSSARTRSAPSSRSRSA